MILATGSNSQTWEKYEIDLPACQGKGLILHFEVYNNGINGKTSIYVDDVQLIVAY